MKTYLFTATILVGMASAGAAIADDDLCWVPISEWQPRSAVQEFAAERGWTVRRIKVDDGCYEVKGRDAQGRRIEAYIDPKTLAIVEFEHGGFNNSGAVQVFESCNVPMANWQPRDAVKKMAEDKGWTVHRIKTDDGCYEIKGLDADGREIEATVDPATLDVYKLEFEDDH